MDVAARVPADSLDKSLGQRLVIENRAGSGGNIGTEAVAKADPDGYTLGLSRSATSPSTLTSIPTWHSIR